MTEEKIDHKKAYKLLSNYLSSDLIGFEKDSQIDGSMDNISAENLKTLVLMILEGELSSRGAKDALLILYQNGGEIKEIAEKNNLIQKSDEGELKNIAQKILDENPDQVEGYKNGEEKLLQYFIGQGMKATQGSANPGLLAKIFKELL